MAYHGKFYPKNPSKYKGDLNNITYRSLWERRVMVKLDEWDEVIQWNSEEIIIPYRSPIDGKIHRYFPDFGAKFKMPDGSTKVMILEVKPKIQTVAPKQPKRITKRFIGEVMEWGKNQAKWSAATAYCLDRGWEFRKLTEDDIFGKKSKPKAK